MRRINGTQCLFTSPVAALGIVNSINRNLQQLFTGINIYSHHSQFPFLHYCLKIYGSNLVKSS